MALQMDLVPYPHPKHPNPCSTSGNLGHTMAVQMDLVPYPHPKHPNPSSLHQEIWGTPWLYKWI